ncbi:RIP metalloprotease [Nocardioides sp.]|uniref:M50 family metallopeptidase n=1 Tax=Nocardioides sp. TaxID=35761 RepID=UPI00273523F7|nr:site-2 protease family protein [Nocardioides sp.]MDP3891116.1 site-2 protease family protein [Nocardioides sp.]
MTTVVLYTLGVLLFAVGIAASIGLHELGHLAPAKKFGVKVTQYFVGFGRTVWSVRRGETEYGFKAIPLGGYVKLVGMFPPHEGDDPTMVRKSNTGLFTQVVSDARVAEYELVEEDDRDRLFYKLSWWKKLVVMAGGPTVNLLIAFALFGGVFMLHGIAVPTRTLAVVTECVVPASEQGRGCTADDPPTPAVEAGLLPGDQIVGFNGVEVEDWDQLQVLIRANTNGDAAIEYVRDGDRRTATTNTTVNSVVDLDDRSAFVEAGFLGVSPTTRLERQGPVFVVQQMGTYTWETVKALGQLPVRLYDVGKTVLGLQERDPESPMSVVGAGRVAGEISSNQEAPGMSRLISLLMLLAGVNLFLGMFNFVPLLPLDGGHIAGALYEGVRRGWARVRGRPDPGYVDVAKLLPVAYAMALVLVVMSVMLIYADIVAPVRLG